MLGDIQTPVSVYLRLRDIYPNSFLLESSDYHARENSFSYIGFDPVGSIKVDQGQVQCKYPDGSIETDTVDSENALDALKSFCASFQSTNGDGDSKYIKHGLFGFVTYESVQYFENIQFDPSKQRDFEIPNIHYLLFRYVIAFDHFNNKIYITENNLEGFSHKSEMGRVLGIIQSNNTPVYHFTSNGQIDSDMSDEEYRALVSKAIEHSQNGDTFQMVISRAFSTGFTGDEFMVYRALRSINPSPYLFFFDYGSYKIFGSSPEAQLVIKDNKASIFPIAGTYKRSGDDREDYDRARKLATDEKESAEHIMLVDLARNDLSKTGNQVEVEVFKEVQYFSHVIHLVSKVSANISDEQQVIDLAADTFPAGTLSGAPKHKAMQLIENYEKTQRGYYGGMIGFMDFSGNFNHAIIIRSFLSQNGRLHFRAGAGIVAKSVPENELQEVYNKTGALVKAIELAEKLNRI